MAVLVQRDVDGGGALASWRPAAAAEGRAVWTADLGGCPRLACDRATCWAGTARGSAVAAGLQSLPLSSEAQVGRAGHHLGRGGHCSLSYAWPLPFPSLLRPGLWPDPGGGDED